MLRREHTLNVVTNLALIVASLAVVASSSVEVYSRLHRPGVPASPKAARTPAAFRPGDAAPSIRGIDYARSDRTLLLFLSTKCRYCEMSVPFYRELAGKLEQNGSHNPGRLRLVGVFPQEAAEVSQFESAHNLKIETVPGASLGDFGIPGTPTALLVSRDGSVLHSWVGAPSKGAQHEITAAFITQ